MTALIALSLGVALVSWLKAGSDDARQDDIGESGEPDGQAVSTAPSTERPAFWAHRKRDRNSDRHRALNEERAARGR